MKARYAVFAVALGLVGLIGWRIVEHSRAAPKATPEAVEKDRPVPVVSDTVRVGPVPLYLRGIGAVEPFNTVVVRSRVDGQVMKVAFNEGEDVKAGQVLVEIDRRPLEASLRQLEANLKRDQAQLVASRADLERIRQLAERQYASRQALDKQIADLAQQEAAVAATQALIDSARIQIDYATITAPISGRAGFRTVDAGNIVRAGDQQGIVTITQIEPISVVFTLPAQDLPALRQAMAPAKPIEVDAFDRDNATRIAAGELAVIDNQIDATTGTIRVKATFANTDRRLWPGQFVNARVLLSVRPAAATVPAEVVQRGPNGPYAYVLASDNKAELRPVTPGPLVDGRMIIEDGLKAGERVVVEGQYRLQPGRATSPTPIGEKSAAIDPGA